MSIEKHIVGRITPSRMVYEPIEDHIKRREGWLRNQRVQAHEPDGNVKEVCQILNDPKYREAQKKAYGLHEEWTPYREPYAEPVLDLSEYMETI